MDIFLQLLVSGAITGAIYGLVAVGFVLIYKCTHIFNFAQGELLLLGAYIAWAFLQQLGLPFWLAIILSLIVTVALGFGIERFPLRPMIGQPVLALIMITLALSYLFRGVVITIWGGSQQGYGTVFPPDPVQLGVISLSQQHLWAFGIVVILLALFAAFFRFTRTGLAMRGVAEGHQIVQSMGINVSRIFGVAWAIAFLVATIGGILLGAMIGINLSLVAIGMRAIPAAFVGGLESIPGAVVGGLLIGIIESLASGYVGLGAGEAMSYLVMILVLIVRPHGLFGLERIERV